MLKISVLKSLDYYTGTICGTITFKYQISDGKGGIAEATVTVTVGNNVAYGMCFFIKASEIDNQQGGVLSEFIKRPKVYANYTDPIKNRAMRATVKIITKVPSADGSKVTEVKCEWKRNVLLYNKKSLAAANKAGTYTSTWIAANSQESLISTLTVKAVTFDKTKIADTIDKKMKLSPPVIIGIEQSDGTALGTTPLKVDSVIVIKGEYFGTKAPKVWLEYINIKGQIKAMRCKIIKPYAYANIKDVAQKSCMHVTSGVSEITIQMPEKWPEDWVHGSHDLVINNKVGMATTTLKTQ